MATSTQAVSAKPVFSALPLIQAALSVYWFAIQQKIDMRNVSAAFLNTSSLFSSWSNRMALGMKTIKAMNIEITSPGQRLNFFII
jgi:hypothetical protein